MNLLKINENHKTLLVTKSKIFTATINEKSNEIYLTCENTKECLTWELTEKNIKLVNSAMIDLMQKNRNMR